MTEMTLIEAPSTDDLAETNARFVEQTVADGGDYPTRLKFLRYRPIRELRDALDKATREDLDNAAIVLTDAVQLAQSHTGGLSPVPVASASTGDRYVAIVYPVTDEDTARVLEGAATEAGRLRLPGGQYGWRWSQSVQTDPEARTVVITLTADHPQLRKPVAPPAAPAPPVQ
jgi:hypothetical protein